MASKLGELIEKCESIGATLYVVSYPTQEYRLVHVVSRERNQYNLSLSGSDLEALASQQMQSLKVWESGERRVDTKDEIDDEDFL